MALQLRRRTNAQRLGTIPLQAELVYTTDTKNLYVGDGITAGGNVVTGNTFANYDLGDFNLTPATFDADLGTF